MVTILLKEKEARSYASGDFIFLNKVTLIHFPIWMHTSHHITITLMVLIGAWKTNWCCDISMMMKATLRSCTVRYLYKLSTTGHLVGILVSRIGELGGNNSIHSWQHHHSTSSSHPMCPHILPTHPHVSTSPPQPSPMCPHPLPTHPHVSTSPPQPSHVSTSLPQPSHVSTSPPHPPPCVHIPSPTIPCVHIDLPTHPHASTSPSHPMCPHSPTHPHVSTSPPHPSHVSTSTSSPTPMCPHPFPTPCVHISSPPARICPHPLPSHPMCPHRPPHPPSCIHILFPPHVSTSTSPPTPMCPHPLPIQCVHI